MYEKKQQQTKKNKLAKNRYFKDHHIDYRFKSLNDDCNKVIFESRKKAKVGLSKIKPMRTEAGVYFCEICNAYHLTSQTIDQPARIVGQKNES